jgi:hypothetical protein
MRRPGNEKRQATIQKRTGFSVFRMILRNVKIYNRILHERYFIHSILHPPLLWQKIGVSDSGFRIQEIKLLTGNAEP